MIIIITIIIIICLPPFAIVGSYFNRSIWSQLVSNIIALLLHETFVYMIRVFSLAYTVRIYASKYGYCRLSVPWHEDLIATSVVLFSKSPAVLGKLR